MEWHIWFSSLSGQRALFALALLAIVFAALMAVKPRGRRNRPTI